MINKIGPECSFKGTTIIKKEGGGVLTREILNAVGYSKRGICNTRMDGFSLIVVEDVFEREEQNYLRFLKKKGFEFVNSTKVINASDYAMDELKAFIRGIAKSGLL